MSGFRDIRIYLQRWNGSRNVSVPGIVNAGQMFYTNPYPSLPVDITRKVINGKSLKFPEEMRYGLFDFAVPSITLQLDDMDGSASEFIARPSHLDMADRWVRVFDQIFVVTVKRNDRKIWNGFFRWGNREKDTKKRTLSVKISSFMAFLDETFEGQKPYATLPTGAWTTDEIVEHIQDRRPIFDPDYFAGSQRLIYSLPDNWWIDEEEIGNYLDVFCSKCKVYGIRADRNPTFRTDARLVDGEYIYDEGSAQWYYPPETKLELFEISSGNEKRIASLEFPSSYIKDHGPRESQGIHWGYIQNIRFCLQDFESERPYLWVWTRLGGKSGITFWRINANSGGSWRPDNPHEDFNIEWQLSTSGETFCRIHNGQPWIHISDSVGVPADNRVRSWPGKHGDYRNIFSGITRNSPRSLTGYGGTSGAVTVIDAIDCDATDVKDSRESDRIWGVGFKREGTSGGASIKFYSEYYERADITDPSDSSSYWPRVSFPWDVYYGKKPSALYAQGKAYRMNSNEVVATPSFLVLESDMPYRYTWYRRAKMWLSGVCLDNYADDMIGLLIDCAAGANCDLYIDADNNLYFVARGYGVNEWTLPDRVKENIEIEDAIETEGDIPELSRIQISESTKKRIQEWYRNVYLWKIRGRANIPVKLTNEDETYPRARDILHETIDGESRELVVTRSEYDPSTETVNLEAVIMAD